MQFSEMWLRELSRIQNEISTLKDQLTFAGLEVEAVAPVAAPFSGVVVGKVIDKTPHPNADRLNVCRVDVGMSECLQIVCGGVNVNPDQKVPVALVGAKLPGDFEIKKSKIRGVDSMGMICASKELGFEDDGVAHGIWVLPQEAPVGMDLREYLKLNDHSITLGITPNRGDCLSLVGVAREVSAMNGQSLNFPKVESVQSAMTEVTSVKVAFPEDCPIYVSRVIRGISKTAQSPMWLVERLRRCGAKSIHPAVDVTNYVMFLLGQPMHAFDRQKIQGALKVSKAGENSGISIALLDGSTQKLQAGTLLIEDDQGPIALAGIMGGSASAVTSETVDILFESAHFTPQAIAGFPRKYGLHSESSYRFERGVDPQLPEKAIELATEILLSIAGGEAGPVVVQKSFVPKEKVIMVRLDRVKKRLGIPLLDLKKSMTLLSLLDLNPQLQSEETFTVTVPSHRFDLEIEEDISEEIARLYGLNHIEAVLPSALFVSDELSETNLTDSKLASFWVDRGFTQTIHYSFIDPKWQQTFYPDHRSPVLKNPMASDMAQMRGSLLPGLLSSVVHNLNRQVNRVHLFETGRVFWDEMTEVDQLALVKVGLRDQNHWSESHSVDFFDLKGDLEAFFDFCQQSVKFSPLKAVQYLHPNQSAEILLKDKRIGVIGALHPRVQKAWDIKFPVFVAELDKAILLNSAIPTFKEISKYPSIRRDLALVLDQNIRADDVVQACQKTLGSLLVDINIFDVYSGKNVETGKKSLAISFTLQDLAKTLVEEEVHQAMNAVLNVLETTFKAKLRE